VPPEVSPELIYYGTEEEIRTVIYYGTEGATVTTDPPEDGPVNFNPAARAPERRGRPFWREEVRP
jgi:hypothetical protein